MKQINSHLLLIRQELEKLNVWEIKKPKAELLASQQPFAIDTLRATQWLQWILIPRMNEILSSGNKLPTPFSIAPYFEQVYQQQDEYSQLIKLITELDTLVNELVM
ncbi:YqcC family protein [Thorsellia kenyensis]|uniref:YqcC family protein n=1 Tax=Thorsellia kenyensis TaxID=1549888 RepID=A0ABV6C8V4_9GAMM